ncbi:hypothetical protein BH11BAC3_BH11BAC3_13530 [soil metagenome]
MAKNKTTETSNSVAAFIQTVKDETKRNDCISLTEIISKQTGYEPKMWGPSIVGFGSYHYKYESGREGDAPLIGFSPRAVSISLYLSSNFEKREELLGKLGKHKADKACVHIKTVEDIDIKILQKIIINQVKHAEKLYPAT